MSYMPATEAVSGVPGVGGDGGGGGGNDGSNGGGMVVVVVVMVMKIMVIKQNPYKQKTLLSTHHRHNTTTQPGAMQPLSVTRKLPVEEVKGMVRAGMMTVFSETTHRLHRLRHLLTRMPMMTCL